MATFSEIFTVGELGEIDCTETELSERVTPPSGRDAHGALKERAASGRTWKTARRRFGRILCGPLSLPVLSLTALILTAIYIFRNEPYCQSSCFIIRAAPSFRQRRSVWAEYD